MADHTYKFKVAMSCGGCSGAVNRVLGKLDGVKSYDVSLESKLATVVTEPAVTFETVYETIEKTRKTIEASWADGVQKTGEAGA